MKEKFKRTNYDDFADIYDSEYKDYHATIGDIDFYDNYANLKQGKILDIGCGTGRIAIELAKKGHDLIGLDISRKMLENARHKANSVASVNPLKIQFIEGDMRNFDLGITFNLIYIGFRSFMLLLSPDKQRSTLKCIFNHLSEQGFLIISLFVPTRKRLERYFKSNSATEFKYFREFKHLNSKHKIIEYEKCWCDEFHQIAFHKLKHVTLNEAQEVLNENYRDLNIRWTYRQEFRNLVELLNYEIVEIFGNYNRERISNESTEMIWILRKSNYNT